MKTKHLILQAALLLLTLAFSLQPSALLQAAPLGTAFTYQGKLTDGGPSANGLYDLRFAIYDASGGGSPLAGPLTNSPVTVSNGLFTVLLDFGAGVFTGDARWLEIAVRTNGGGAFATFPARQQLTPAPAALYAPQAGSAATVASSSVTAQGLSVPVPPSAGQVLAFNGTSLVWSNAGGGSGGSGWSLTGNAGTTPGANFLGTTDNQALELKVNSQRGLRLEPTASTDTVNVIGGSARNFMFAGAVGATIGGGGAGDYYGTAYSNSVWSSFGVVGGGIGNTIGGASSSATIAGGRENGISTFCVSSTIGGGWSNTITSFAAYSTIAGGAVNAIGAESGFSAIGGGWDNSVAANSTNATIAGGWGNDIGANTPSSAISGGEGNDIGGYSPCSAIGGGKGNTIGSGSREATIAGGRANDIAGGTVDSAIGGGYDNNIDSSSDGATIAGGYGNDIGWISPYSAIGGGYENNIPANAEYATIPGGCLSFATNYAFASGRRAKANHTGAFVWADSTDADFASTTNNQFNIRASGGVRVDTGAGPGISLSASDSPLITRGWDVFGPTAPAAKQGHGRWGLFMETLRLAIGIPDDVAGRSFEVAKYSTNGTRTALMTVDQGGTVTATAFNPPSDRNLKENFAPVDSRQVLEKVAALPIARWNFKADGQTPHLGPVAQDFHAAFGLGTDDKHIATVDADGVALAAIQGLNQKLEAAVQQKDARIAELERRLAALERILNPTTK
jgi:hypothetical protein